jgi:hypothetical protein
LKNNWNENGNGVGINGQILTEMLHHSTWASTKCASFFGREKMIANAIAIIDQPNRNIQNKKYNAICLSIIGESGAGKTSLMAK